MSVAEGRAARFRGLLGAGAWPVVADPSAQAAAAFGVAEQIYGVLEWVSRPSTFVVDPGGVVRWSYVGRALVDRPSLHAVMEEL